MNTHRKSDLKWYKEGDTYYLVDETRPFSNLGYVDSINGFFAAYHYVVLDKETYKELGFYGSAYDAKRAVEEHIPLFYE